MSVAQYTIGPPVHPTIYHDNGFLDKYAPQSPTWSVRLKYAEWKMALELVEADQHTGVTHYSNLSDAIGAYRHFLEGTGSDRTFSYERYVANDPSGQTTLSNAIEDAEEGASQLYHANYAGRSATFPMTGTKISCGSPGSRRFPYPATENWQKAIGAHEIWLSADVTVTVPTAPGGDPRFEMRFTLHAEDRYNFNPDNADITTGIPDAANGQFEVTGLARQYTNYSTLQRTVGWTEIAAPTVSGIPSHRQRQPSDNRRVRNRM